MKGNNQMKLDRAGRFCSMMAAGALTVLSSFSALAEDAYVEATGTQHIDTHYYPKPTTRIEVDFETVEVVKGGRVFGCSGDLYFDYTKSNNDNDDEQWSFNDDKGSWSGTGVKPSELVGVRRTVIMDGPANLFKMVKHDGSDLASGVIASTRSKTASNPLGLFVRMDSNGATGGAHSKTKLYGVKIYESGNLVHDLKPHILDGAPGLRDAVTCEFLHANAMLGYGGSITSEGDGYIESTGSQILDTGYFVTPRTRIEFDFASVEAVSNARFFGCREMDKCYFSYYTNTDGDEGWCCSDAKNFPTISPKQSTGVFLGLRRKIVLDGARNVVMIVDPAGTPIASNEVDKVHENASAVSLAVFGMKKDASLVNPSKLRVYGVKLYEAGVLQRDFRPCIEYGKPGLKDRLSGVFCANTILTDGDLIYGGDIHRSNDAYVESDGSAASVLDTGYFVKPTTCVEFDFAAVAAVKNARFFGSRDTDKSYFSYYTRNDNDMKEGWCFKDNSGSYVVVDPEQVTTSLLGCRRTISMSGERLAIYDRNRQKQVVETQITEVHTKTSGVSLAIFGRNKDGGMDLPSKLRIHRVRIFEGVELMHDFVPCAKDGLVGFYDLRTAAMIGRASGLTLGEGSTDVDESGSTFLSVSPDCAVGANETVTLTALADGKVDRYEWTKDGILIAGGTTGSLTVSWERRKTPIVYGVTPVYVIGGREVRSAEKKVKVTCAHAGVIIVIR